MTNKLQKALDQYSQKMNVLKALSSAQALLGWDRETHMPKGASADRGHTVANIAGLSHQLFTEPRFIKTLTTLYEQRAELAPEWQRSVMLVYRELQKSIKLDRDFVEETNRIFNASHSAWLEAKAKDDFSIFQPHLEKVVENRKQYAAFLDPNKDPYDVQLDDYEEGLTIAKIAPVFKNLRTGLTKILPTILEKQHNVKNPLNDVALDQHEMRLFLNDMLGTIGFNLERGAIGDVEHPFETTISANDIRVNTRFDKSENSFTIMGMIHEVGHGMYEQNTDPRYEEYFLDHGVTLGIHESQSRFLENVIGRSSAFWSFFLPKLQQRFPQLQAVSVDEIVAALNLVKPTFIRTEADEVTYNLHIILRFEIEMALLHNTVQVSELPELWHSKMKELVGVSPKNNRDGVLQDIHWAWGNFGYFPTYTLGNLNAAQLYVKFGEAFLDWQKEIAEGNFSSYIAWFKEHIWRHGSFYTPDELMQTATGEKTNEKYLLKYLKEKYLT